MCLSASQHEHMGTRSPMTHSSTFSSMCHLFWRMPETAKGNAIGAKLQVTLTRMTCSSDESCKGISPSDYRKQC